MYGPEAVCGSVYFNSTVTISELAKERYFFFLWNLKVEI